MTHEEIKAKKAELDKQKRELQRQLAHLEVEYKHLQLDCEHPNEWRGTDISGCSEGGCPDCGYYW